MSKSFRFEPLHAGHLPHLQFLFKNGLGVRVSQEFLRQKYRLDAPEYRPLTNLVYNHEQPVAFLGAIPMEFLWDGQLVRAVQTCDTMTLKSFRGMGIHQSLMEKLQEKIAAEGFSFAFTMHSENTFRAYEKLPEWKILKQLKAYQLPGATLPTAGLKRKSGFKLPSPHPAKTAMFPNPLRSSHSLSAHYYLKWFHYKQFTNNLVTRTGPLRSWLRLQSDIWVGAIETGDKPETEETVDHLRHFARKNGYRKVIFVVEEGCAVDEVLAARYQSNPGFRIGYYLQDRKLPIEKLRLNLADLDSF